MWNQWKNISQGLDEKYEKNVDDYTENSESQNEELLWE